MKLITRIIYTLLISICSISYAVLAYAKPSVNTPPQEITCESGQCKFDNKYLSYLQFHGFPGNGTYIFESGVVFGYPENSAFYTYRNKTTSFAPPLMVIIIPPMNADISNPNWKMVGKNSGVYECKASADQCPFNEVSN